MNEQELTVPQQENAAPVGDFTKMTNTTRRGCIKQIIKEVECQGVTLDVVALPVRAKSECKKVRAIAGCDLYNTVFYLLTV